MPRPKSAVPSYRLHRPSGRAVVTVPLPGGDRKDYYLGEYNTPESRVEYRRLLERLGDGLESASAVRPSRLGVPTDVTVAELIALYVAHAAAHYRHPSGEPTSEYKNVLAVLTPLRELFGGLPGREFGPLKLQRLRDEVVARGWSRRYANANVNRVRRFFEWCVSQEMLPAGSLEALKCVAGLQPGRSAARERPRVGPVPVADFEATLAHLGRHAAGMARFQMLTGCRSGEVRVLRHADIDSGGPVWRYSPGSHKTAWRGKGRVVLVGPKAQALLAEFPTDSGCEFVFSPRRAAAELSATRAAARKTPRYPSHVKANARKRQSKPRRTPGERYTRQSYARAIHYGVKKANAARLLAGLPAVPHWSPLQVRKAAATRFRAEFGLKAAQVLLGHAHAGVTEITAERDLSKGNSAALLVG